MVTNIAEGQDGLPLTVINLTPHTITVLDGFRPVEYAPSGLIARRVVLPVTSDPLRHVHGAPILIDGGLGPVEGLPPERAHTFYLVSTLVRQGVPHRRDVLSPGELVRDADGQPLGCLALVGNP